MEVCMLRLYSIFFFFLCAHCLPTGICVARRIQDTNKMVELLIKTMLHSTTSGQKRQRVLLINLTKHHAGGSYSEAKGASKSRWWSPWNISLLVHLVRSAYCHTSEMTISVAKMSLQIKLPWLKGQPGPDHCRLVAQMPEYSAPTVLQEHGVCFDWHTFAFLIARLLK